MRLDVEDAGYVAVSACTFRGITAWYMRRGMQLRGGAGGCVRGSGRGYFPMTVLMWRV